MADHARTVLTLTVQFCKKKLRKRINKIGFQMQS